MDLVPTVDIAGWDHGAASTRASIAASLDDACRRIGFFQLIGHGVGPEVVSAMVAASDRTVSPPVLG
ncbi:MAG: 2-oxoglutarate and iron-dependent oxygenase domain-containing protein, partial [Ilumatobacteraceae bacterium]